MDKDYKIIIIFFAFFINICNVGSANSNIISNINITANIKDNGNVEITEIWKGDFYSGTELYHSYDDLIITDISNFYVEENGVKFKEVENWNIADSRDLKKYKVAINQNIDGIELVWGIGEAGYHEYKLKYTLNGIFQNGELKLNILDVTGFTPENVNIVVKGAFDDNAFATFKNCIGNIEVKSKEVKYNIDKINDNLIIYLNYAGIDNSLNKDNIIRIKSNSKNKLFFILRNCIIVLIFLIFLIISFILLGFRKREKYEFKPF